MYTLTYGISYYVRIYYVCAVSIRQMSNVFETEIIESRNVYQLETTSVKKKNSMTKKKLK